MLLDIVEFVILVTLEEVPEVPLVYMPPPQLVVALSEISQLVILISAVEFELEIAIPPPPPVEEVFASFFQLLNFLKL